MKIIKKPIIKRVVCENCGCIFQPKHRNLRRRVGSYYKDSCFCPYCKKRNSVKFEKETENKLGESFAKLAASAERNIATIKKCAEQFKAYDPSWVDQDGK